jgi:o-succinylbenzoate---CoA ligase
LNEEEISSWCCLPLNHVGGMMQVFRAIYSDGKVLFSDYRKLLEEIPSSLVDNQWLSLVPTQLHNLLSIKIGCENLRRFKGIFIGGAAISENIAIKCRNENIPIFPTYGMSETAGMVTILRTESFHNGQLGVGKVLPHAQLVVETLDKRISVKSDSMCLNLPDKNDWLKTPDYGQRDKSGNWFIDGRIDRFIISGGEKVNPFILENILNQNELVDECLVVGLDDQKWGKKVVCYITPQNIKSEKIIEYTRKNVEPHMMPKEWHFVKRLPLNKMGKPNI